MDQINKKEGLKVSEGMSLDWLSFSWDTDDIRLIDFCGDKLEAFYYTFPEIRYDFVAEVHVKSHYERAFQLDHGIMVFYDSASVQNGKGINVSVPAHGLSEFFEKFKNPSVRDLFEIIISRGGRFSRLDLCFDDYKKTYRPIDYMKFDLENRIKTRFRFTSYIKGTNGGYTFELGKRGSDRFVRIYDKDVESKDKETGIPAVDAVRYEFEITGAAARGFSNDVVSGKCATMADLILSCFSVVDTNCSKRGDCSVNEDWMNWVKTQVSRIDGIKPSRDIPTASYDRSLNHFKRQWTRNLAMFVAVEGTDFLEDMIKEGTEYLSNDKKRLILMSDVLDFYHKYKVKSS